MTAALITGGTSGIGLATAHILRERGYRVAVTGGSERSVAQAAAELPGDVLVVQADARSLADTDRLVTHVRDHFGELSALFLNAGVTRSATLEAVDEDLFDDLFAVNTKGTFFTLQKTLPLLSTGSSVVMTVGIGATRGVRGAAVAAASRGALLAMLPSLALELAPRKIRINTVSPGPIDTPIWSRAATSPETVHGLLDSVAARVPLGRLGTAREVAATVAFLVSDAASYITGQDVVVAGGSGLAA